MIYSRQANEFLESQILEGFHPAIEEEYRKYFDKLEYWIDAMTIGNWIEDCGALEIANICTDWQKDIQNGIDRVKIVDFSEISRLIHEVKFHAIRLKFGDNLDPDYKSYLHRLCTIEDEEVKFNGFESYNNFLTDIKPEIRKKWKQIQSH